MTPVRTVAGKGHVRAAEGEVLSSDELWAAGEDVVVGFEDEFGELRRGDDYSGDLAELKVDDRAEFLREPGEGVVGHVGEEM